MPVFLIAAYKKGEKMNLTMAEREQMRTLVDNLVRQYHQRLGNIVVFGKKKPA
jgi:hypothetical protein